MSHAALPKALYYCMYTHADPTRYDFRARLGLWPILVGGLGSGTRYIGNPVAPVAYQVILEPGIVSRFRESESPRVHTLYKFVPGTRRDFFMCTKLTSGKRRA